MLTPTATAKAVSEGKLEGYGLPSSIIDAAISTVFLFDDSASALKLYKGDSDYFKIGTGEDRIDFITKDFAFNNRINPNVYLELHAVRELAGGGLELIPPESGNDNLLLRMKRFDTRNVLSDFLYQGRLTPDLAFSLGKQVTNERLALQGFRIEGTGKDWYELFLRRIENIETWPAHISGIDTELMQRGFLHLREMLEELKPEMSRISGEALWLSTDCTSENMYVEEDKLYFFDAFHPQADWRNADFEFDLIRIGSDIGALAGEECYDSYLKGVQEVSGRKVSQKKEQLYHLFSSQVVSMYLCFRSIGDSKYIPIAKKHIAHTKFLIDSLS